jgi:small-conductance mechanosensitive channel
MANEYFFFYSKKAGVPLLLVNIASLILFLIICAWAMTYFFDVKVTSVLATSAVLTIVLGLAMQETLGNLFAAISLQIDKPFAMDDWIELHHNGEIIAGQVKELSWRATLLQSMTDEMITIPNRTISQWQIINFSGKTHRLQACSNMARLVFGDEDHRKGQNIAREGVNHVENYACLRH